LPVSTVVPAPIWLMAPVPLRTPPTSSVSDRLNASAPLLTTSPAMLPVLPPLPICRVPALIVVPPL
jgi:hypothetical protein